jgi:tRNA nucleotidyltransferase (CCA-adding enzyme)
MDIYLVGGAVRDALLQRWHGIKPGHADRDWVVVGSTPEAMSALSFTPVGKDFPVFLHPQSHEEYALARTERKTAQGYHGFAIHAHPDVTLPEDLARRDLTVNAMAVPLAVADGKWSEADVIDPYGGMADTRDGVLRHVTPAFAEDPVRILRLARFAARWPHMRVAPETMALMRDMVERGEVNALVPERVWQELARGLMEAQPSRMFQVLRDCTALAVLLPELDRLWGVPQRAEYHPEIDTGVHAMLVIDMAAQCGAPLSVRYACLCHDLGKGTTPTELLPRHLGHEGRSAQLAHAVGERWRVPKECKELADVVAKEHGNVHRSSTFGAAAVWRLIERCDGVRRPERFAHLLLACECDARGRAGLSEQPYAQRPRLMAALEAALAVATAPIAQAVSQTHPGARDLGLRIGEAIAQARQAAVAQALSDAP